MFPEMTQVFTKDWLDWLDLNLDRGASSEVLKKELVLKHRFSSELVEKKVSDALAVYQRYSSFISKIKDDFNQPRVLDQNIEFLRLFLDFEIKLSSGNLILRRLRRRFVALDVTSRDTRIRLLKISFFHALDLLFLPKGYAKQHTESGS